MPVPSDEELLAAAALPAPDALERLAALARRCTRCRLHLNRTTAVPGEGPHDATLVLVGEAPGATEDRVGRPFQGASGRFLDRVLSELGVSRARLFITSVNKCRPPHNRPPLGDERDACGPYLDGQLGALRPAVVLAMGRVAAGRLVPRAVSSAKLTDLRRSAPYVVDGGSLHVTCHPAAAMRFPAQREAFRSELAAACRAAGLGRPRNYTPSA